MTDTAVSDLDQLPEDVRTDLAEALKIHDQIAVTQAQMDALLAARRAKVLRIRARGVSGYRLARHFGVSGTSIGNWTKDRPGH